MLLMSEPRSIRTFLRRWWIAVLVTVLGVALLAYAFFAGGQDAGSVAVELGGSLALVALLLVVEKHVERRLEARVEEAQAEVLAEVDRVSTEVRDLDARISSAAELAVSKQRDADGQLFQQFLDEPNTKTLRALQQRCGQLGLSSTIELYPDDKYAMLLSFKPDGRIDVGLWEIGRVAADRPARKNEMKVRFNWPEDGSLSDFMMVLHQQLAAHGLYPGDDLFISYDLPGAIVEQYQLKLAKVFHA